VRRAAGAIAVALMIVGAAVATTVKPLSVEELTTMASTVVEAQAGNSWSAWNPEHSLIYTYTQFTVTRALKGGTSLQVTVKQLGGAADGYVQRVPGVHGFLAGEQAVLFLRPSSSNDRTHVVVGLVQGNFRVYRAGSGQAAVTNGVPATWAVSAGGARVFTGTRMSLQELESRVQGALR
jgi:hypothetical protein